MAALNYIKIESAILPAIYPSYSFVNFFFNENRVVLEGSADEINKTDESWNLYGSANNRQRVIQTISYRRYRTTIYATETAGIPFLKDCETVIVTLENGEVHHAEIIDITEQKMAETEFTEYTLRYKDINIQNYQDEQQPVNNFHENNAIYARFGSAALYNITLSIEAGITLDSEWTTVAPAGTYTLYTRFVPKIQIMDFQEKTDVNTGLISVTNSSRFKAFRVKFFLQETEKNVIEKYLPMFDTHIGNVTFWYNSTTYTSLQRIIPIIKQIETAINLYDVELLIPYEQLYKNHYE